MLTKSEWDAQLDGRGFWNEMLNWTAGDFVFRIVKLKNHNYNSPKTPLFMYVMYMYCIVPYMYTVRLLSHEYIYTNPRCLSTILYQKWVRCLFPWTKFWSEMLKPRCLKKWNYTVLLYKKQKFTKEMAAVQFQIFVTGLFDYRKKSKKIHQTTGF